MDELILHDFVENEQGELALLVKPFANAIGDDLYLMVSSHDKTAYLHRGSDEAYVLDEINPKIIDKLRSSTSVLVIEMDQAHREISTSYDVPVHIMDQVGTSAP